MRRHHRTNPFELTSNTLVKKFRPKNRFQRSNGGFFVVDAVTESAHRTQADEQFGPLVSGRVIMAWSIVLAVGIGLLLARTAYLQIIKGSYYESIAEGNRLRIIDIKAPRGLIYDRYQTPLVENVASFSLAITPVDIDRSPEGIQALTEALAKISDKSPSEITALIEEQPPHSYQPVIIQNNLTHEQAVMTEIIGSQFSGVVLLSTNRRHYLTTSATTTSMSHVVGYLGSMSESEIDRYRQQGYSFDDYVGKAGIELTYETVLKGVNGKEQVEVDAIGEAKEVIASQKPRPGHHLVLTIDSALQLVAEQSLRRSLVAGGNKRGAVVALDPYSGEVLALVSLPAFDSNLFSRGISRDDFAQLVNDQDRPLFNRVISGEYPSGSTFKLIVGAAALQEGMITKNTGFNSVGGIRVNQWFFPDWKAGGHGWTTITKAIAESVNTFFYTIGGGYQDFAGLGVDTIARYAHTFGLGSPLGIDLPNEGDGFLPSREWKESVKQERWYIGDTYNLSIGQGDILVTPLQVASWTAVFANGGTLYRPYVVKEIVDVSQRVVQQQAPEPLSQDFIDPEHIATINQGLRQAVTVGSAQGLLNLPIMVAAKTGTAQWSSKNEPHAWLTAFAPYGEPRIVVTVLVEEGIGGTTSALPVARDILKWWAENR